MGKIIYTTLVVIGFFVIVGCATTGSDSVLDEVSPDVINSEKDIDNEDSSHSFVDKSSTAQGSLKSLVEQTVNEDDTAVYSCLGTYRVIIQGFNGVLKLAVNDGKLQGTLLYHNWGKGIPVPLTNLSIRDNKIYFERSVQTREELIKYGGNRYFTQRYFGEFSDDKTRIRGSFIDSGTDYSWEARKK